MFDTFIVQPLFNVLVLIYALIPGHNFGLAIILFTVLIRVVMWPLLKKQLHHAKAIRELQPELKKIKAATKGDKQKESMLVMELYKERQISPFGSLGLIVIQFIILIGLYSGLQRMINNPQTIIDFSYSWIRDLSWMRQLATDISQFDATLFGFIDLARPAVGKEGGIYIPAMVLVVGSALAQFFQSGQLMPVEKDGKTLRMILKEAGQGKQTEQAEMSAALNRSMRYVFSVLILLFTAGVASALSLYWLIGGLIAYYQQSKILGQDETELEKVADSPTNKKEIIEGEIVEKPSKQTKNKTSSKKSSAKKRRKR